jgi:hypothetical protein
MNPEDMMSRATPIVPFWHRLPVFFAFPLQPRNLLALAGLSFGWLVFSLLPGGLLGGLLMLVLGFALIGGFSRYWFNVLDFTAYGYLDSSDYPAHKLNANDDALIKLLFVLIIQSVVLWSVLHRLGPAGHIAASAISSLIMPATTMLITLTGSVLSSLNPLTLLSVMLRIGSPYLLLYAFLFMLQVGAGTVLIVAVPWLPDVLKLPVVLFCIMFSALIMAQMMGYVLYQNHGELGLQTRQPDLTPEEESAAAMEELDDRIQQFIDDNNFAAAVDWLRGALKDAPDDMARHERYHRLLVLANDPRLQRHSQEYIGRLLTAQQPLEAFKVLEACWRQQPDWQPEVHLCLTLARLCFERGRIKDAVRLLKDFHKRYPGSTDIPEALLLQARILIEHYEKREQALPFLKALQVRYPGHSASQKADALLRAMG